MIYLSFTVAVAVLYTHAAIEIYRADCRNPTHMIRETGIALSYWGLSIAKGLEYWTYATSISLAAA